MSRPLQRPIILARWRSRLAACIRPVNRCCTAVEGPEVADCVRRIPRLKGPEGTTTAARLWLGPLQERPEEIVSVAAPPGRLATLMLVAIGRGFIRCAS